MNAPTDWGTAVAILAAGLILGMLFVYLFNKRRQTFSEDLVLKDLQAKRDLLVQQLRDPAIEGDERTRLELETAQVLRQLDTHRSTTGNAGETTTATPAAPMNPTIKGFLWGASSVAALVALGYFVMQQTKPRAEGGSLTGGFESGQQQAQPGAAQPQRPDPAVQQLEAAVQKDPENIELRNDLAQAYLQRENLMGVFEQTKFVLAKSPNDSRALTLQALVRMAMGDADEATQMLKRATQLEPKNLDGWVSLAWIYVQTDKMDDAERMIAEAIRQSPGDRAQLENVFASMKQAKNQQPAQTADALPEGHPAVGDTPGHPPASATPPAASGASVRVTVDVAAGAKARSGILFIMARNPAGGPPVAAKRVMASSFPMTVELSAADSMMGQPFPPSFRLEARLDSDGDAMTRVPTDPSATQEGVSLGSVVTLALK